MNSSFAIRSSLVMTLAAGGMSVALAQKPVGLPGNYPNKPVRIIIGNGPGGATDTCGRTVATLLSQRWGSPVFAENIPSNGGIAANAAMMRVAPDGYTLLATGGSALAIAELVEKVPYNVRTKFPPIAQCTANSFIVTVNNDLPVRNVKEFIAYAKANPNKLNYAYSGAGEVQQLFAEALKIAAGIDIQGIPFKGFALSYADQMAGRVNLTASAAVSAGPLMKSGKIRAIAVGSAKRLKAFPDVPTVRETLPTFDVLAGWAGTVGLEGMSPALINGLNREINAVLGTPETEKMLTADGSEVPLGSPEDFRRVIADGLDSTARIVKQAGIKMEGGS